MNPTNVQNAASVATLFILLAILLVPCRVWCRGVAKKVSVGPHRTRAALTGRIICAMSWRIGIIVFGIISFALTSAHGPNDLAAQNLVSAAILCYPLVLLSLWQIGRRISKRVFQKVSPGEPSEIAAAASEAAIKANRFWPTIIEGIVAAWFALTLVSYFVVVLPYRKLTTTHPTPTSQATSHQPVKVDNNTFGQKVLRSAEGGDARSQYLAGLAYASGAFENTPDEKTELAQFGQWRHNLPRPFKRDADEKAALEWFRRAAENEYPPAQLELAERLYWGAYEDDTKRAEALLWYRKAAVNGLAEAQFQLWDTLENEASHLRFAATAANAGVEKIATEMEQEAVTWLQKAAEHGLVRPQLELANINLFEAISEDTPEPARAQRKDEAIRWFRTAALLGNPEGQFELAWLLSTIARGVSLTNRMPVGYKYDGRRAELTNNVLDSTLEWLATIRIFQ